MSRIISSKSVISDQSPIGGGKVPELGHFGKWPDSGPACLDLTRWARCRSDHSRPHEIVACSPDIALSFALKRVPTRIGFVLIRRRRYNRTAQMTFEDREVPASDEIGLPPVFGSFESRDLRATIVGVVSNVKYSRLDEEPAPEIYIPYTQGPLLSLEGVVLVRTPSEPSAIASTVRKLVSNLDPIRPIYEVVTLEQALANTIVPRRLNLLLLGTFAASALILALIGIYGVIEYSVMQRTSEIGMRMALGAHRTAVLRMVVYQGLRIVMQGLIAGLFLSLLLTRLISSLLYDVTPHDIATYVCVSVLLVATSLAACCRPAVNAALVDPVVALRYE